MNKQFENQYNFTQDEWESCLKVLHSLKENPLNNPDNKTFGALVTKIHKTAKKELKSIVVETSGASGHKQRITKRKHKRQLHKEHDLALVKKTQIVHNALSLKTLFTHDKTIESYFIPLKSSKSCYCCDKTYTQLHSFYHKLCPNCATLNYNQRALELDLSGRNVILTGGRVKVGYATALRFLRSGANLTITSRFPALSLEQFKQEHDYEQWAERLSVYGLDLRNLRAIEDFIAYYKSKHKHLDILVNNAAQTIKYMEEQYRPLIQHEQKLLAKSKEPRLIANTTAVVNEVKSLDYIDKSIAKIPLNRFGQPVDFREKNSWNSTLEEISTHELLEVNLINNIAPYMLIKELTPLFRASSFKEKFIVNVSSSEGQFSYANKTVHHPHTNMTKAALNMMTRTSGHSYAEDNIYMSSVDVGWISTGLVESKRKVQFEKGSMPPLDSVDGASRIFHPIYEALVKGNLIYGKLLKDYRVVEW